MDSSNPHTYSPFMDLLTSQQESHNPECLPLFSPSSSQVPQFVSSQYSVSGDQNLVQPTQDERRDRRRQWSTTDDLVLISAWLNTSKDPIVSNEQKAGTFWKRVGLYFCSSPAVADKPKREPSHCKQRWHRINDQVGKFAGCYPHASGQRSSGQSEDDVIKLAYEIFYNDHQARFTLEHAWRELRFDQKWCTYTTTKVDGGEKRTKLDETGAFSATGNRVEEETEARPPGIKAAKGKGKRSGSKRTVEEREASSRSTVESMWIVREKDLASREKLSKQTILNTLLAKTEPLSEIEETLKNKLLTEMLQG